MTRPPTADLAALDGATARLIATVEGLDPRAPRAPSILPGWSVGHVLTHLARNADGMLRLVDWASSGVPTPMYDSMEARGEQIERGSGRTGAELASDVTATAAALAGALERFVHQGDEALDRLVLFGAPRAGDVPDQPAHTLVYARLREVEIHHVDLGLDSYTPLDWPDDFVERTLLWIHGRSGPVDVVGHPAEVLAWRLGRGAGPSVRRRDGTAPGEPPAW